MNKIYEEIETLQTKCDKMMSKIKTSKTFVENAVNNKISFVQILNGSNRIVSYDLSVFANNPVNIVVKIDNVVIESSSSVVAYGEIMLKAKKLYTLKIDCEGENLMSAKLRLESADLKVL